MAELMIHLRHLRQAKLCMKGSRPWFAAQGWDWVDFITHGRPAADFIATGDPLAMLPVRFAEREAGHGG